jgi:hypothetical protein
LHSLSTAGTTSCQGRETELSNWEEIAIIRNFTIYVSHALLLGLHLSVVLYYDMRGNSVDRPAGNIDKKNENFMLL